MPPCFPARAPRLFGPQQAGVDPLSGPAALPGRPEFPHSAGAAERQQSGLDCRPSRHWPRLFPARFAYTSRKPRAAPRRGQCARKAISEICLVCRSEKSRDLHGLSSRNEREPLGAKFFVLLLLEPHKGGIKSPFHPLARGADLGKKKLEKSNFHIFIGAGSAETRPEGKIKERDVDPHESDDWPGAQKNKGQG